MLSHWTIKLLNMLFVCSLFLVAFRLLCLSLSFEKVKRSLPASTAAFFLKVMRDDSPYLSMALKKSNYLIGRGQECDIFLKGQGIPMSIGELICRDGDCFYKTAQSCDLEAGEEKKILPGEEIVLYNYKLKLYHEM